MVRNARTWSLLAVFAVIAMALPLHASAQAVTQGECNSLREAGQDTAAARCEEELAQQAEAKNNSSSGSSGSGTQNSSQAERRDSNSVPLAFTGFPVWALGLVGAGCVLAAALLFRRPSRQI